MDKLKIITRLVFQFICYLMMFPTPHIRVTKNVHTPVASIEKQWSSLTFHKLRQGRRSQRGGGGPGPPVFGKSVTSISNKGADYAHHSTMGLVWLKFAVVPLHIRHIPTLESGINVGVRFQCFHRQNIVELTIKSCIISLS